jgi:caffeoyl-CoA O-methyltransferase
MSHRTHILEVGTLIGYSAVLMAKEMKQSAHLITVEIHEEEARTARENIEKAKVPPKVEVIVGNAIEVIPRLRGKFDLVFIDAEKNEYLAYLRLIEPKLHQGSALVADNAGIFASEIRDYIDYVRSSKNYSTKYVPVDKDGLEVSIRL